MDEPNRLPRAPRQIVVRAERSGYVADIHAGLVGWALNAIMLFAWHAAHRILCSLHDIGIHKGPAAKAACYGAAVVVTAVAGANLFRLGF